MSSCAPTPRWGPGWLIAAALMIVATSLLLVPPSDPANAQELGSVALTVSDLTGALGPGSERPPPQPTDDTPPPDLPEPPSELAVRALIEHTDGDELDQLRLVVEVHPPAGSRGELRDALDGDESPTTLASVHDTPIRPDRPLQPGELAGVELRVPADQIAWAEDGGVHPVRIAVQRGTEVLDEVTTAVVWLAELPESPLLTTALWPMDTPPWRGPGPAYPEDVDTSMRPGGRLDSVLRGLERFPDAGVVVAPSAHLLEDLRDRADGFTRTSRLDGGAVESRVVEPEASASRRANDVLQRVRSVIATLPNPPIARPYADADLLALSGIDDVQDLAGELATTGRHRLQQLIERRPDPTTYVLPERTSPEVLDLMPAEIALVPYGVVEGPDPASNPTLADPVREVRAASGRPFRLIVGDPYVTELLAEQTDDGSTLGSQRVIAETAMVFFESPGASGRTLSIHPPETWDPSAELAGQLLERLTNASWLQLSDPSTVASSTNDPRRATLAEPALPTLSLDQATRLATALADLSALSDARNEEPRIGGRDTALLRDQLLRSTSRWFPAGSGEADELVEDVENAIDATLADVQIASGSLVTLTSDTGSIPITLERGGGGPIDVQVEVTSQGRLAWPDGRQSEPLVLEEGTTQTVSFETRALSTGTFSVSVRVTDPSGRLELDRTTLSVRSTAISGFALTSIAVVVVALLLAGVLRRRPDRRRLEVVR